MELTLPELHCSACLKEYPLDTKAETDRAIEGSWSAITVYGGDALCGVHLRDAVDRAERRDDRIPDHIDAIPPR